LQVSLLTSERTTATTTITATVAAIKAFLAQFVLLLCCLYTVSLSICVQQRFGRRDLDYTIWTLLHLNAYCIDHQH